MGLSQCLYFLRLVADSTTCFLLSWSLPRSVLWPFGWIIGLRLSLRVWGGSVRDIIRLVCSGQRCRRGLGVRESVVYRLCVFTFLMVSASFRDCWKWKEMLLFCLVMEKSNPIHQGIQMKKAQLFIWWVLAVAFWAEREMTSLMNLRLPQWTEAWEKLCDPVQHLITPVEVQIYTYCRL